MIRILIVGPDGTGKTSLAHALEVDLLARGFETRARHLAPSARSAAHDQPVDQPHDQPVRNAPMSIAKLLIAFARYAVALSRFSRGATQIDILERGWDDQLVDPLRYRLHKSSTGLARLLGRFLPRSDLCVLLAGDAAAVHDRKNELPIGEIDRQIAVWRVLAPQHSHNTREMDCLRQTPESMAATVGDLAVELFADHDPWRALWPSPSRIDLRVVSGDGAVPAMSIYQPMLAKARHAGHVARAAFRIGLRLRTSAPLPEIRAILASFGMGGLAIASIKSSTEGRHVVGVAQHRQLMAVLKIGLTNDIGLTNEAQFLAMLEPTGLSPEVLAVGLHEGFSYVLTRAVQRSGRSDQIAVAQAAELATSLQAGTGHDPIIHGDFAPWNMVPTDERMILLDWEYARVAMQPMHDLAHYVVSCGALLGRWSPTSAISLLTGRGSPGALHLAALGIDPAQAPSFVRTYLENAREASDSRLGSFRRELETLLP